MVIEILQQLFGKFNNFLNGKALFLNLSMEQKNLLSLDIYYFSILRVFNNGVYILLDKSADK